MRMKATWTFGRTTGAATAVVLAAFVLVGCSAESNAQTITVDIGEGVTLDMVWIAPGRFTMGQNHNMPDLSPAPELPRSGALGTMRPTLAITHGTACVVAVGA